MHPKPYPPLDPAAREEAQPPVSQAPSRACDTHAPAPPLRPRSPARWLCAIAPPSRSAGGLEGRARGRLGCTAPGAAGWGCVAGGGRQIACLFARHSRPCACRQVAAPGFPPRSGGACVWWSCPAAPQPAAAGPHDAPQQAAGRAAGRCCCGGAGGASGGGGSWPGAGSAPGVGPQQACSGRGRSASSRARSSRQPGGAACRCALACGWRERAPEPPPGAPATATGGGVA
jgi:hypothetical protein